MIFLLAPVNVLSRTKASSMALVNVKIYNPWHIKRTWVGSKRQIQPNIAGLWLECKKVCDTCWLAMEGKLLRNLGQSSRTGDSSQYNICVINAGHGWIEVI